MQMEENQNAEFVVKCSLSPANGRHLIAWLLRWYDREKEIVIFVSEER